MAKGDRRTAKGKRFHHSFGNTRPKGSKKRRNKRLKKEAEE